MGNGRCMIVRASIYRQTRSVSWICFMSWNGCGRWPGVSLTSEPEAQGASVGGRASQEVAGGESGRGDSRDAIPGNPAWFEGTRAEDRAGCGRVFRAESRSDEV